MANPLTPFVVNVTGTGSAVAGDSVRVTVYSSDGTTARGSTTAVLDSSLRATVDLANVGSSVDPTDTVVISLNGAGLGSTSVANAEGGARVNISSTSVAFPSRSL